MNEVTRYSDMQIEDAFIRSCMEIKENTVPDTEMWVREIDYDALRADFLNAVQGRDIAINERDLWKDSARAFKAERDAALAECARLRAALVQVRTQRRGGRAWCGVCGGCQCWWRRWRWC